MAMSSTTAMTGGCFSAEQFAQGGGYIRRLQAVLVVTNEPDLTCLWGCPWSEHPQQASRTKTPEQ